MTCFQTGFPFFVETFYRSGERKASIGVVKLAYLVADITCNAFL